MPKRLRFVHVQSGGTPVHVDDLFPQPNLKRVLSLNTQSKYHTYIETKRA